jgi:hypothetical protein
MKKFYFLFLFALIASISNLYAVEKTVTYTFTSKTWEATCDGVAANWTSIVDANDFIASKPAATGNTKPSAESPVEYTKIKSIAVSWSTTKKGEGSIAVYVGGKIQSTISCSIKTTKTTTITPTDQDGKVKFVMTRTNGNVYLPSIAITYEDGTSCGVPTFSVEEGTYSEAQAIKLTAGEGGEVVYYTINDGPEQQYIDEPIKLEEDGTYKISAYTAATETLGKSATVTKTYVINFPLEVPYILCQNAAWLTEGTKIIFVGKNATTGGAFGMAAQNGTKYREQDIVTLSGDEKSLISKGDKVRVFTVEKSGNDIAFKDIEGYLSADNTKNSIQTKKTIGSDSYWTVSVAADGVATVASKTATTYKCIMYNAGNTPRFSAYKADFDGAVYIYLLGSTSSVSSMSAEGVKVFAAEGGVKVVADEAADVAVYTVAGQLVRQARVAEGSTLVNVAPGFYVVRANGTATKVIVR